MNDEYLKHILAERQQFIFDMANDEWVDDIDADDEECMEEMQQEMDRKTTEFVTTATNPFELHFCADHCNSDGGVTALSDIAMNPHCDAATALLIFWRALPAIHQPGRSARLEPQRVRSGHADSGPFRSGCVPERCHHLRATAGCAGRYQHQPMGVRFPKSCSSRCGPVETSSLSGVRKCESHRSGPKAAVKIARWEQHAFGMITARDHGNFASSA